MSQRVHSRRPAPDQAPRPWPVQRAEAMRAARALGNALVFVGFVVSVAVLLVGIAP